MTILSKIAMRFLGISILAAVAGLMFTGTKLYAQQVEGFDIAVDTSAGLLVVDPLGHREGIDPAVGRSYKEIAHSVFMSKATPSLDNSPDDQTGDVYEFMTNPEFQPTVGSYLIRLYGTKDDSIRLTLSFKIHDSSIVRDLKILKGQVIRYKINYVGPDPHSGLSFDSVSSSSAIKAGVGIVTWGSANVKAKPSIGFSTTDTLREATVTIRWKTNCGFNLGTLTSSTYGFVKFGDTCNIGTYTYQRFQTTTASALNWQASQEYTLFTVALNDPVGVGRYELTNGLADCRWSADINYLDKTDSVFYQPTAQGFAYQNKSTTTGATAYSGERHATIHGTKFHEVFESGGEIVYRRKDLNSASWDTTTRISAGNGSNSDASIVVAHDGSVHVVWQRQLNANAFALWYNKSTDGGYTWGNPFRPVTAESIAIIQQNQWNIYPVLAELGSTQLVVVVCSSAGPRYTRSTNLGANWDSLKTITGVSSPSYVWHPSLAPATNYLILSYDNRYYGLYTKKYDGTSWLGELSVTGGVGTIYDRFSSVAVDAYRMPQIAWCAQRSGSGDYRIIYKPGVVDATSWPSYYVEFSHQTGISDLYPSISAQTRYGITWRIDVLYPNSANQVWLRQQTAYTWGSPSQVSSSGQWAITTLQEYGSALYDDVRLWTDQSGSSPYEIKRTSDAGYQLQSVSGPTLATELHRRVTIESPTNRSFISYEVGPLKVVTAAGDTTTLPFKAIDKSRPLAATVDDAWDYLGTDSVSFPANARYLLLNAEIQNVVREDTLGVKGAKVFLGRAFHVDVQGSRKTASAFTDVQGLSGAKVIDISSWAGQKAVIRPAGSMSIQGALQPVVGIGDIYVNRKQ